MRDEAKIRDIIHVPEITVNLRRKGHRISTKRVSPADNSRSLGKRLVYAFYSAIFGAVSLAKRVTKLNRRTQLDVQNVCVNIECAASVNFTYEYCRDLCDFLSNLSLFELFSHLMPSVDVK